MVKIAAKPTAVTAYQVSCRKIGQFVWLGAGWMTCVLGCVVVKMLPWPDKLFSLLIVATVLVVAVASAAISVSWYRAILLDETSYGVIPMTFGARELRYLLYQSAIGLVLGMPIVLLLLLLRAEAWWVAAFSFLRGGGFDPVAVLRLVGSVAAVGALIVLSFMIGARLALALVAAAIDEPGSLLRESWHHTRSNAVALLHGWLGCILPAGMLWTAASVMLTRALGPLAGPAIELFAYLCYFAALGLTAAFFAYVFAQYAEGDVAAEEVGSMEALPAQ